MGKKYLYQVLNFTSEEMFFGTADIDLDQELERLVKDPKGPMSGWKKGDVIRWRALSELTEEAIITELHKEIQAKTPPNKYKVIQT